MNEPYRYWAGAIFAAFSLLAGCGSSGPSAFKIEPSQQDETLGRFCADESDCLDKQVCESNRCYLACFDNAVCSIDESCEAREFGLGGYCAAFSPNPRPTTPPASGMSKRQYFIAQVLDTTTQACDSQEPGADIVYLTLEDSDGTVKAFGNLIDDGTTGENNAFNFGLNLNGLPPTSWGSCPESAGSTVTSLGCGGFVTLEFLNDSGDRIGAQNDDRIRVFEYGFQCGDASPMDEFDILLCTDPTNTPGSCTVNIGGGSEEIVVTVP